MLRNLIAVLVGLILGVQVNTWISMDLSSIFYQLPAELAQEMPEGLNPDEQKVFTDARMEAWVAYSQTLPATAFILPILGHLAMAFCGGWVAAGLSSASTKPDRHPLREGPLGVAMIVGVLSLIAGITNAVMLSVPIWMWIEMPFYLVLAWAAGNIEVKRRAALA
jgi:hypothetical protein